MAQTPPSLSGYPLRTHDKLRYADTDRQGHVNNAVFATLLETGRVELLYGTDGPLHEPGCSFVIASLHLEFLGEITWPGRVEIGTRVAAIGTSSMTLDQGLFQDGRCAATARTVIVQVNDATRRSQALSDGASRRLAGFSPRQEPRGP
jgi:acyl-CoA thioester hydrolase